MAVGCPLFFSFIAIGIKHKINQHFEMPITFFIVRGTVPIFKGNIMNVGVSVRVSVDDCIAVVL